MKSDKRDKNASTRAEIGQADMWARDISRTKRVKSVEVARGQLRRLRNKAIQDGG